MSRLKHLGRIALGVGLHGIMIAAPAAVRLWNDVASRSGPPQDNSTS